MCAKGLVLIPVQSPCSKNCGLMSAADDIPIGDDDPGYYPYLV